METKNFYALATLGLNPDGTSAEEKKHVASVPNRIVTPITKKKENA